MEPERSAVARARPILARSDLRERGSRRARRRVSPVSVPGEHGPSAFEHAGDVRALNAELERRIAERSRQVVEAGARLDSVLRQLPVGVLMIDAAGKLELANDRAQELLGLSAAEIAHSLEHDLWTVRDLHGAVIPQSERPSARALATGEPSYNDRVQLELPNGRRLVVEGSAVPVTVDERAVGVAVTFQDITAQEQRERAERDFVTNAAHELQTPIAAITSGVQVLQAGAKESAVDRDRFLAHIEAACTRLDRLTRALLVLARAQAGDEDPRAELIEVEALLQSVAAALPPGAEVEVTCSPGLAVVANRALLEQSLVNLGMNAVKYTAGKVRLAAARDDGRVLIEVRDDGTGIDAKEQSRVFERFYRGSDAGEGFGLGLAIVAEAVRAINGELKLDSTKGGTGVSIRLPAATIVRR
jgi:two-component system, OmpR family, phosphate regulon sensor histidine kinase PhoR